MVRQTPRSGPVDRFKNVCARLLQPTILLRDVFLQTLVQHALARIPPTPNAEREASQSNKLIEVNPDKLGDRPYARERRLYNNLQSP
jgi:hypothetical protein